MLTNFLPDLKTVLTPALVSSRLRRYERPGMYGMHAKGLYSSSCVLSSLNGSTSKRLSGIWLSSLRVVLFVCVCLFRSFFLG